MIVPLSSNSLYTIILSASPIVMELDSVACGVTSSLTVKETSLSHNPDKISAIDSANLSSNISSTEMLKS